jgi:hypothetical protein
LKKFVVAAAVAVVALASVATATAASLPTGQFLRYSGAGEHAWNTSGGDSPNDTNAKSLRLIVGDPSAGEYVAAYSKRSSDIATDANAVKNLSFEFKESAHVGAGAPRISVQFQNGDVAYLSAFYCNQPMAVTGDKWGRADFTRFMSDCSFFVTGDTAGQYAADGSRSAWQVYTDAHPDQIVEQAYLVADETGGYHIDRLSLGAGVMYTSGNQVGKLCTTEASC